MPRLLFTHELKPGNVKTARFVARYFWHLKGTLQKSTLQRALALTMLPYAPGIQPTSEAMRLICLWNALLP